MARGDVAAHVLSKPTGRYARVLWWLYEEFTGTKLDVPDLVMGGYVNLLDENIYVTGPVEKIKRQRINMNLLGSLDFSPMVRNRDLGKLDESFLKASCEKIAGEYPPEIFERAVRYLYAKESKSSHEIERETPDHRRTEKFIGLLEDAWKWSFLSKKALVWVQQNIVDTRYANDDWRSKINEQVYVGETLGLGQERIHFAAPKPGDIDALMSLFFSMADRITNWPDRFNDSEHESREPVLREVPTLVAAAVISFGKRSRSSCQLNLAVW